MSVSDIYPVSPMLSMRESDKTAGDVVVDLEEEELDPKSVVVDDPSVGEKFVTLDEHGPGTIEPKIIPDPKEMSVTDREKHLA